MPAVVDLSEASDGLSELFARVDSCRNCPLCESRTRPVFGTGSETAGLMFVGEAPGYHEDQQGVPFVGQAGKLLDKLLARIGLGRADVYIANVLKCRPPDNRDPQVDEIEKCRGFLDEQISLIRPKVICTLGNFATKLLSGKPDGISRVHGQARELAVAGCEETLLYPVYHPAAALYTPSNLKALEEDFDRLAGILGIEAQPVVEASPREQSSLAQKIEAKVEGVPVGDGENPSGAEEQLGLF